MSIPNTAHNRRYFAPRRKLPGCLQHTTLEQALADAGLIMAFLDGTGRLLAERVTNGLPPQSAEYYAGMDLVTALLKDKIDIGCAALNFPLCREDADESNQSPAAASMGVQDFFERCRKKMSMIGLEPPAAFVCDGKVHCCTRVGGRGRLDGRYLVRVEDEPGGWAKNYATGQEVHWNGKSGHASPVAAAPNRTAEKEGRQAREAN